MATAATAAPPPASPPGTPLLTVDVASAALSVDVAGATLSPTADPAALPPTVRWPPPGFWARMQGFRAAMRGFWAAPPPASPPGTPLLTVDVASAALSVDVAGATLSPTADPAALPPTVRWPPPGFWARMQGFRAAMRGFWAAPPPASRPGTPLLTVDVAGATLSPTADPAALPPTVRGPPPGFWATMQGFWAAMRGAAFSPTAVDPAVLFGLLGYDAAVVIGLVTELGRVAAWNAAPQLAFGLPFLTVAGLLLPVALMAALKNRHLSALCAKLAAVILTDLLVVAISTRFGHWGNLAAVPLAIVVTCIMTGIWMGFWAAGGAADSLV